MQLGLMLNGLLLLLELGLGLGQRFLQLLYLPHLTGHLGLHRGLILQKSAFNGVGRHHRLRLLLLARLVHWHCELRGKKSNQYEKL